MWFSLFIPSYILWSTPQDLTKWINVLRYISVISFISIGYVVVKLEKFKFHALIQHPCFFCFFFCSYSPKHCSILLKFWPEVVQYDKHIVWKYLQNFEIWLKCNTLKVYSFGSFRAPIYCRKTKYIAKNQNFCRNSILSRIK